MAKPARLLFIAGLVSLLPAAPVLAGGSKSGGHWSTTVVGDTTFTFLPHVEISGGYDSNPDDRVDGPGTRFEKFETGLAVRARRKRQLYVVRVKGRQFIYNDFENNDRRFDFRGAIDTKFDLANNQTLKIGSFYMRDFVSFNKADIIKSYIDYNYKGDNFKLRAVSRSRVEINKNGDVNSGGIDPDVFDVIQDQAFDYSKTTGQLALLTFTKFWLQPFVIYNYADIDYFHQASDPIFDRMAVEHFAIAGVRFQPSKKFRIDVGARHNYRDMDDVDVTEHRTTALDVNFVWRPTRTFKLTGVYERVLREPSTSFGLVDDLTSYGMTVNYQLTPKLRLSAYGYYDHLVAVGDDLVKDKYYGRVSATYNPVRNVDMFVSVYGKYVKEQFFDVDYDRLKVEGGVRVRF